MAGIYIHIPFCKQACTYCDFHFSTSFNNYRQKMIDAICKEVELRKNYITDKNITTIYFGGGTPSTLHNQELNQIINKIHLSFDTKNLTELTLEANPDDITDEKLLDWKNCGINRLSIGVQSFLDEDLTWMNRAHNAAESQNAILLAKKHGFKITIDLMYGLPNTTHEKWASNIELAISLQPDHISAYCLTIEEKTKLNHLVNKKLIPVPGEDVQALQFETLLKKLSSANYEQYEISNFAKNQNYAEHNTNYWKGKQYLGLGPSAHSFNSHSRSWNISNNQLYMKGIQNNIPDLEIEELSVPDQFNELILTGLRTKWGVNIHELHSIKIPNEKFNKKLNEFINSGHLRKSKDAILTTEAGKLIADYISSELFIH